MASRSFLICAVAFLLPRLISANSFGDCAAHMLEIQIRKYQQEQETAAHIRAARTEVREREVSTEIPALPEVTPTKLLPGRTFKDAAEVRKALRLPASTSLYGPFHRLIVQGRMTADRAIESGYLAGSSLRNFYRSSRPCAKAFNGPLPSNYNVKQGFTFYTTVPPHQDGMKDGMVLWYEGDPGTFTPPITERDYTAIPIYVIGGGEAPEPR